MSQRVVFESDGMWPIGKILTTCGHYEVCLEDPPKIKQVVVKEDVLPEIPKLKENQRAVLVVGQEGIPEWRIRDLSAKSAAVTSGWFSLGTIIAVIVIVKKILKKWEEEEEG